MREGEREIEREREKEREREYRVYRHSILGYTLLNYKIFNISKYLKVRQPDRKSDFPVDPQML